VDLGGTSDFPGPTAQDMRLEKLALDAVWRQATAETYKVLIVELQNSEGRLIWKPEARACHSNVETGYGILPRTNELGAFCYRGRFLTFGGCWLTLLYRLRMGR
jgi:hypothetical protein